MDFNRRLRIASLLLLAGVALSADAAGPRADTTYKYFRLGKAADAIATPRPGYALMGGGTDLDEAFKWLCERAGGGDFLILRASGDDDYNPYVNKLCKLNSVATLIVASRMAANDEFVARTMDHASAIFIAGGDQANYINFWMGTPMQKAINDAIGRGVPIGGTSAGLAVMGEWAYTAQGDKPDDPNLDSKTVLMNPLHPRVTLVKGFLNIPILKNVITDSHFAKRDRMGRLLGFLARLDEPDGMPHPPNQGIRGIGIQERAAVLLEPDGQATVVGKGDAYFCDPKEMAEGLRADRALAMRNVDVQKVEPGHVFNVKSWTGDAVRYTLSVEDGVVHSTQAGGGIY